MCTFETRFLKHNYYENKASIFLLLINVASSKHEYFCDGSERRTSDNAKGYQGVRISSLNACPPTAFIDGSLLSVDFLSAVTSAAVTVRNSATGEIVYSSVEMNVTTLRIDLTGKSAGEYSLEIGIGDTILSGDFLLEYE